MIPHRLISPAINVAFVIGSNSRMPRNRHIRLYILVSQKTVSVITVRTGIYAIHASRYLISIAENRQSNRNHNATAYAKFTTTVSYTISITATICQCWILNFFSPMFPISPCFRAPHPEISSSVTIFLQKYSIAICELQ